MPRIAITGGPGVGKTTLLAALAAAGHATVPETARALMAARRAAGLPPRPAPLAFAQEIVRRDLAAWQRARQHSGPVFFDRGLVDGLGLLHEAGGIDEAGAAALLARHGALRQAFVLPPWPAIFCNDSERDQTFDDCLRIHDRLLRWYERCGLQLHAVPTGPVADRMAWALDVLAHTGT